MDGTGDDKVEPGVHGGGACPAQRSAQDREAAAAFCRGRDVACPSCNYNLRDAVDAVCPECGRALVLRVDDPSPQRRAALWVSCAWCGTISCAYLSVEVITWRLAGGRPRRYGVQDALETALLMLMLAYTVALLVVLVRSRGRRLAHAKTWLAVGWVLWGVTVGFIAWSALWIIPAVLAADA